MGLEHLHKRNVTHGDLNCKNVIVDEYGNVQLSNYGNLNQLFETCAIKNDQDNLSQQMLVSTDELMAMKQNDILGIGFTVYEFMTGEIVNS